MAEHPIIFSTEMVRAILDGRKTQTRRIIRPQPIVFDKAGQPDYAIMTDPKKKWLVGDRLWVREAWCYAKMSGYDARDDGGEIWYRATDSGVCEGPWKPSIHMFRKYARIFLEITNIRVERVQDISEEDAEAEGITDDELSYTCLYDCANRSCDKIDGKTLCDIYHTEEDCWQTEAFGMLWDSLNAKRGYGWDKNPWVWVIEFKRVT